MPSEPQGAMLAFPGVGLAHIPLIEAFRELGVLREVVVPLDLTDAQDRIAGLPFVGPAVARRTEQWTHPFPAHSAAVVPEIVRGLQYRLPGNRHLIANAWSSRWRRAILDRNCARRIEALRPAVFLGPQGSSRRSIAAVRRLGGVGVVKLTAIYWAQFDELVKESLNAPDPETFAAMRREMPSLASVRASDEEVSQAGLVIVFTETMRRDLIARGVAPDRVAVLPVSIGIGRYSPVERDYASRPLRALFTGRIGYAKGVHHAVRAAELAGDALEELLLVGPDEIAGTPARRDSGRSRFLPPVPHTEIPGLLANADVFVLPTLADALPRSVLEAMSSGLPVITTTHSGFEDVITDGVDGFIVPPRDPDAIAERIRLLSEDGELRRTMGRAARGTVEGYDLGELGGRFREIVLEHLSGPLRL